MSVQQEAQIVNFCSFCTRLKKKYNQKLEFSRENKVADMSANMCGCTKQLLHKAEQF